jgi:hypothetical protein
MDMKPRRPIVAAMCELWARFRAAQKRPYRFYVSAILTPVDALILPHFSFIIININKKMTRKRARSTGDDEELGCGSRIVSSALVILGG